VPYFDIFFFHAEDGIRDFHVTGVQTCALPILAAMLSGPHASAGWKTLYGAWMFSAVLLWDVLVAVMIGNQAVLRRFARLLPWLERMSGAMLILLALGVMAVLLLR